MSKFRPLTLGHRCLVPGCHARRDYPSIKCAAHRDLCPTCLERDIARGLDYCQACWATHRALQVTLASA